MPAGRQSRISPRPESIKKDTDMKYTEYRISCSTEQLDELIDRLNIAGMTDIIITDPKDAEQFSRISDGFAWNYVDDKVLEELSSASVSFYLEEGQAPEPEIARIAADYMLECSTGDDSVWLNEWKKYFKPTRYGRNIVIRPAWADYDPLPEDIVIKIEPGQAFGTGSSPTTALAMELLEEVIRPGDTMLDVGCGTGILSVLGAKLGAVRVHALDLDPEAVRSTVENARLNDCADRIYTEQRDLVDGLDFSADVVAANLTFDILLRLLPHVRPCCSGRRLLICSGIIDGRQDQLAEAIRAEGFTILKTLHDGEWNAILAVLK